MVTYGELHSAKQRLIANIRERCLVFSLCTNSVGSVVGYAGFITNNIVPLLLNSNIDYESLQNLISVYKPSYLWLPDCLVEKFTKFECVYGEFNYTLLRTNFKDGYKLFDELALLMATSGSTGSPKLVRQSHKNIEANAKSIVKYLGLDNAERPITTLPMSYSYGLSIINSHLLAGATILLTNKSFFEKEFWSFFKEHQATSFGGVPYTYEILDKLRFYRMELTSLKTMTQAGGRLSAKLHEKIAKYAKENDKNFIVMYGQTEATARMSYLPREKSLEKIGSIGIAIPGGKFSLIHEDYQIMEPNIAGELVYEGPNVALGYASCGEDLVKGDEFRGRLLTGDMAKKDEDGYYYIVGRKKRFLKIFGTRIDLDKSEEIIRVQFNDLDCACSGIDDKMYIFITNEALRHQVIKFISDKTGLNQIAFNVKTIKEVPRNDSGKILYHKLTKYWISRA